jgi:hypothetical protein
MNFIVLVFLGKQGGNNYFITLNRIQNGGD